MLPAESRIFKTVCSDKSCQSVLYINWNERTVECHQCGQKHNKDSFRDIREVPSDQAKGALHNFLYRIIINKNNPKRGTEMVKVLGLSNYHCKLLSPFLTNYGMDKTTGRAKLLTAMNQGEIFDCSLLSDRAFLIEPEHISINGFGKDITGSLHHLSETLKLINAYNDNEERLIPIHADGDGHCLVHAISRALVGRELFWHPLRSCLKQHLFLNIDKYKEQCKNFFAAMEWSYIVEECDPDFQPPEGEFHGLRNIHIFGLANVLRRPIILLDSLECMKKSGDYAALFLPVFVTPEDCKGKDNTLNKPLCIAWSSNSHNHYIPLVGIQKMPLPILPKALIPKVWGDFPQSLMSSYMEFDDNGGCIIGGNRVLSNAYIQRLVRAMEELYYETHGIHPSLVADAKLYLFPDSSLFSAKPAMVLERAKSAVQEGRLFRCLLCRALCELRVDDFVLNYDTSKLELVLTIPSELQACTFCNNSNTLRKVTNDGTVIYRAEDKDTLDRNIMLYEPARKYSNEESFSQKSNFGNKIARIPLYLSWDGKGVEEDICPAELHLKKENVNDYVKELTKKIIEKHFSENSADVDLPAYVSEEIWKFIKKLGFKYLLDLRSDTEFNRDDSDKTMKLESPLINYPKPSQLQYIKVVTSNGKQANFALSEDGVSYGQLQEWIKNEFNISVKSQIIKKGFPPRPIKPIGDTNKQILTDLKHGDRLIVEIQRRDDTPYSLNTPPRNNLKDSTPPRNLRDLILPRSNVLKESNVPKIVYPNDTSWETIIKSPVFFRSCGFIYKKISQNHTLNSSLHTTLDEYPDKVFCYNSFSDTIDLCVKPLGHFLIASDIEERIQEVKDGLHVLGYSTCPLKNKADEVNDSVAYLRTVASYPDADQSSNQSLLRKGPGFSVLRNPDDVDIS